MKTSSERGRRRRLAAASVLALIVATFAAPSVADSMTDGLEVRILVFSGRSNPSFVLTEQAQIAELRSLVGALEPNPAFKRDSVLPSILGYNGIVVINGAGIEGLPSHLAVYREDVEARLDGTSFLRDPARTLEGWLIEKFVERKLLDPQTLDVIRGEKAQ